MKKGVAILIFLILITILIVSAIILTRNADKQANEQLRKNFSIAIKKSNTPENKTFNYKDGESICENIEQLKLNETFMKSIGCESEETCKTDHGIYYTKKFKCIYTFKENATSVPGNIPFDRQTCLTLDGIWMEGEC